MITSRHCAVAPSHSIRDRVVCSRLLTGTFCCFHRQFLFRASSLRPPHLRQDSLAQACAAVSPSFLTPRETKHSAH
jgi:hypothetical protein